MKNFKEFVKEETENTLDEGIMDILKGLGRGIVGAAKGIGAVGGAVGGGLAGGAKAVFNAIGGGKDSNSSHKYDTWKRDARADADKDTAKEELKKKEKRQELTQTLNKHGTALGFDMSSTTGRAQHQTFMHRLHDTAHPDHPNMTVHSTGIAWDKTKNGGSGGGYNGVAGSRPGVRNQSAGEHEEAKNAYIQLKKDRDESGF